MYKRFLAPGLLAAASAAVHCQAAPAQLVAASILADLSLEQLGNIEVTSVSGRAESLHRAPASIYVITAEDIRRSAATTLPQALRLAPNLQVAATSAGQYAISARGLNSANGNKLLVLVDGRAIYSPLFSGVFWDLNDVMLEDVDRIELISGPGAALWGANAVNGVINVITKSAAATPGVLASVTASDGDGQAVARYGAALAGGGHYRLYGMAQERKGTRRLDGFERPDAAAKRQVGFRADWGSADEGWTVQGDASRGGSGGGSNLAPLQQGANLLARRSSLFADGSPWRVQAYLDWVDREEPTFRHQGQTVDVQFSHQPGLPAGQRLLWGAGYRRARDQTAADASRAFMPGTRTLNWSNLFAQHETTLARQLQLTAGAKLERNDYTGWELLPSVRLAHVSAANRLTWGAASRAVRAPARLDREFFLPATPPHRINGGPDFRSEIADVFELGHRGLAGHDLSYSATLFHQRYANLRSVSGGPAPALENMVKAHTSGLEAWVTWRPAPDWRLSAGLLEQRQARRLKPPSQDVAALAAQGNDPHRKVSLRASWNVGPRAEVDVMVRHIGSLPEPVVPRYTAVDARWAWKVTPGFTLALLGQNLFQRRHVEFNAAGVASQIERRVFVRLAWLL